MNRLEALGNVPVDYAVLATIAGDYQSPKDKIVRWEKSGSIIRLKKGFYATSEKITRKTLSRELIANHLYGPSYISLESALSFYGLIPEKVFAMRSATVKRSKQFSTPLGNFEYVSVPQDYYTVGIYQQIVNNEYVYLLASPEKSLCDKIVATSRLRLQSVGAMKTYLEEDLRLDFSAVERWNGEIIEQCIATGKKKMELTQLLKFLRDEQYCI